MSKSKDILQALQIESQENLSKVWGKIKMIQRLREKDGHKAANVEKLFGEFILDSLVGKKRASCLSQESINKLCSGSVKRKQMGPEQIEIGRGKVRTLTWKVDGEAQKESDFDVKNTLLVFGQYLADKEFILGRAIAAKTEHGRTRTIAGKVLGRSKEFVIDLDGRPSSTSTAEEVDKVVGMAADTVRLGGGGESKKAAADVASANATALADLESRLKALKGGGR